MKKLAKKLLCLTAVLALTLSLFTGCKSKNEKTLFEYAGQEVTFQEAHVYARIMQYQAEAQYGAYFGDSMWSMQVGTDSKGKKSYYLEIDDDIDTGNNRQNWCNGVTRHLESTTHIGSGTAQDHDTKRHESKGR